MLKNQSGFTLIEILLVVAIGAVVTLGLTTMMTRLFSSTKAAEELSTIGSILSSTRLMLEKKGVCQFNLTNNIVGNNLTFTLGDASAEKTLSKIQLPPQTAGGTPIDHLTSSALIPGSHRVTLSNIKLNNFQILTKDASNVPTSYSANLNLEFLRPQGTEGGTVINRSLYLVLNTTATGSTAGSTVTITDCNTSSISTEEITNIEKNMCIGMGGTYNANSTPKCSLPQQPTPPITAATCTTIFPTGYYWDGDECLPKAKSVLTDCTTLGPGWVWDPTALNGAGACKLPPSTMCTQMGFTWNGTSCSPPVATAQQLCQALGSGYTWTNGICKPPLPPVGSSTCASFGTGWTFNGSACVPPTAVLPPQPSGCSESTVNYNQCNGTAKANTHGGVTLIPGECNKQFCIFQCVNGSWVFQTVHQIAGCSDG